MSDIFISYSREDRDRVKPLAEALQKTCGWTVWWDVRIPAGKSFDEVIEKALDEARCVIVVWSETSIKSHWVKTEAAEGHGRGILVPVSIDNVRIPLAFRRIQTANFTSWKRDTDAEVFNKLRVDLTGVLGDPWQKIPSEDVGMANTSTQLAQHSFHEPELVRITGGKFLMGSPKTEENRNNDEQQHEVFVDDFAIGQYPVTFAEYDLFCEETGREKPADEDWGRDDRPVINVSWKDAYDYTQWFARVTGQPYRLPTEAEWEYAARGGTTTAYWWGDKFEQDRLNCDEKYGKTTPMNTFKPNPFGLYDMLGNVWEWTGSLYKENYDGSEKNSADREDPGLRVARGGCWYYDPRYARSAFRGGDFPDGRYTIIGFRLAQD